MVLKKWLFVDMGWSVDCSHPKNVFSKSEVQEVFRVVIAGADFEVAANEEIELQRLESLGDIG
jgi:hypothetical protein